MIDPAHITLAILAGGQATRMGRPKAEMELGGRPILGFLLDRFAWPGPTLLITAPGREQPPGHELFGREAVDPVAALGPLRGLLTALEASATPLLLVATVDMPGVGPVQLRWLAEAMDGRPECLGLMVERDTDKGTHVEPFPSIFRAEAWPLVVSRLESGRRSVHGLSEEPAVQLISAPAEWPAQVWTNLNRPEDVEEFLRNS